MNRKLFFIKLLTLLFEIFANLAFASTKSIHADDLIEYIFCLYLFPDILILSYPNISDKPL